MPMTTDKAKEVLAKDAVITKREELTDTLRNKHFMLATVVQRANTLMAEIEDISAQVKAQKPLEEEVAEAKRSLGIEEKK